MVNSSVETFLLSFKAMFTTFLFPSLERVKLVMVNIVKSLS